MTRLSIYLSSHLAGARAGSHLFRRAASHFDGTAHGQALQAIAGEVQEDLAQLITITHAVGATENRLLSLSARGGAELARLKPNGGLLRRSPLADLVEIEGLCDAVCAKRSGWDALIAITATEERLPRELLRDFATEASTRRNDSVRSRPT